MRCSLCKILIHFAQGNEESAMKEIRRHFPSQSDLIAALKAELAGPLTNNRIFSDFIFYLAKNNDKQKMQNTRLLYDMAIESYTKSIGSECLPVAFCLHRRAACNTGTDTKAADEGDLTKAINIVLNIEGACQHTFTSYKIGLNTISA